MPRVKYLHPTDAARLGLNDLHLPNFHITGSIIGMKKQFYRQDALLVRSGTFIYYVSSHPEIYDQAK